jgi:hypothetical protein
MGKGSDKRRQRVVVGKPMRAGEVWGQPGNPDFANVLRTRNDKVLVKWTRDGEASPVNPGPQWLHVDDLLHAIPPFRYLHTN